jgi:holin-like protein
MPGLAILLFFNLLGLLLQRLGVPLPANVIGLVLFTTCLFAGVVKLKWVESTAQFLLRHMLLFFAPVVVGVIAFESMMRREWLAITVGLVGSFLVVMLVTGWTATALSRGER